VLVVEDGWFGVIFDVSGLFWLDFFVVDKTTIEWPVDNWVCASLGCWYKGCWWIGPRVGRAGLT